MWLFVEEEDQRNLPLHCTFTLIFELSLLIQLGSVLCVSVLLFLLSQGNDENSERMKESEKIEENQKEKSSKKQRLCDF